MQGALLKGRRSQPPTATRLRLRAPAAPWMSKHRKRSEIPSGQTCSRTKAAAAQKAVVTAEGQYLKLEQARLAAAKDGAHSAVVQAISVQNKLFGLEKVVTETTVRMASRVPGVPKELELSVEDWQRQQTALLLGGAVNGGGYGSGNGKLPSHMCPHPILDAIHP